jgi:ABC-type polysaccharide/polyol phosphate export permease
VFGINPGWIALLAVPGLLLVAANGIGFGLILGVLSARFRDIPLIITNIVQLIFFTTPILWRADSLPPDRAWITWVNPVYFLVENVREPLLGNAPFAASWIASGVITLANIAIGIALFSRFRARLAYWL